MLEILHISDLHFGKSPSQNRKATSLLNGIASKYPLPWPGDRYLLVTGDLTQAGDDDQYDLALKHLSPFAGHVFVTPGNHDYGSFFGTDFSKAKARHFDAPFAAALGFTHPFFDKKVFVQQLQNPSNRNPLMIIGLNSCAKTGVFDFAQGEVGKKQLDELNEVLTQSDPKIPKVLFLHHIPNRDAEYELVMTLRDWKKLMAVVGGRVDALAFGHQGTDMEVATRKRARPQPSRPMQVRRIAAGGKRGTKDAKTALVLDADGSVANQAFYRITVEGGTPTAEVIPVSVG